MSLINQVLRDLEQRRETPSGVDGAVVTMPRYIVARGDSPFILSLLALLLVLLSLATGFLIWERLTQSSSVSSHSLPEVVTSIQNDTQASPPKQIQQQHHKQSHKQYGQQVETLIADTSNSHPEQNKVKKHSSRIKENRFSHKPVAETKAPVSSRAVKTETIDKAKLGSTGGTVEKQRRRLTEKQQASRAFQKGYAALRKGQIEKGERLFQQALAQYPQHIKSREMLAGIYIKAGRYVEASELLKQGVALNGGHSMFRKLYARVLLEQNALDSAVAILERRLPQMNEDIDYYALLAALYQRQGRHENAVALYQNMLRQNPMVGIWWIGMGISREKLGDSQAARAAYEKARASGTLAAPMVQYTDNRLTALNEIGYPDDD